MSFALKGLTSFRNGCRFTIIRKLHQNELAIGSKLTATKVFTQDDVKVFAEMVGDINPIHLDKEFASKTKFKRTIVHGVLTNGLFSRLLYEQCGNGALLLNINTNFLKPVFVGDEVRAECEITEMGSLKIKAVLKCFSKAEELLIEGTARGSLARNTKK